MLLRCLDLRILIDCCFYINRRWVLRMCAQMLRGGLISLRCRVLRMHALKREDSTGSRLLG